MTSSRIHTRYPVSTTSVAAATAATGDATTGAGAVAGCAPRSIQPDEVISESTGTWTMVYVHENEELPFPDRLVQTHPTGYLASITTAAVADAALATINTAAVCCCHSRGWSVAPGSTWYRTS